MYGLRRRYAPRNDGAFEHSGQASEFGSLFGWQHAPSSHSHSHSHTHTHTHTIHYLINSCLRFIHKG